MVRSSSLFSQVLGLISRIGFEKDAKAVKAERHAKGFSSWDHFVSMIFCQLAQAQSLLPKDSDLPKVSRVDISAAPVLTYAVSGDISSERLRKLIEDRVQPGLQQIEGVAGCRSALGWGGRGRRGADPRGRKAVARERAVAGEVG